MKNLLSLVITLLFSTNLSTQNINQEYIFSKEKYNKIYTAINVGGNTYLGGSMLTCQVGSVSAISHDNNLIFNDTIPQDHDESFWYVSNLEFRDTDSLIIGAGNWNYSFDIGTEIDGYYIFGMDLDGNKLFESHLPEIYSTSPSLTLIPSGMVINMNSDLIWLNHMGEIQNTIAYNTNSSFQFVDRVGADTLVACTDNEVIFLTDAGSVSYSFTSTDNILDLYVGDEYIYFLRENDLMIYEIATGTLSGTSNYISIIDSPQKITGNNTSLFIYGGDGYPNDQVIQLNQSDLQIVNNFSFDQEETEINFITATDNELQLFGTVDYYQSFVKTKNIASPLQYEDIDIGISNITPLDSLIVVDSMIPFGADEYLYEFEESEIYFSFDVTNHGTEIITSFSLVADYSIIPFGCYPSLTTNYYDNFNILPGETITLASSYNYHFYFLFQNSPVPEISVELFAPNHKFDSNIANNRMPGVTPVLTDTEELNSFISSWNIFSNPTHSDININATFKENPNSLQVVIYDTQGRNILSRNINTTGLQIQEKIDTQDLPNGLYWLSIYTGDGVQSKFFSIIK